MFSGVVLVAEGNRILAVRTYGPASYELGVPLRPDSRFRIASLSKQFTQLALAALLDQGRLSLDSRLSEFIPDFPRGNEITIRHLVEHRSGIPHTNDLPEFRNLVHTSLANNLAILRTKPLDFAPGTAANYSNGGYDVLAAVIERVAGMPFEQFVHASVLQPLGLEDTGFLRSYAVIPGLAEGYAPGDDVGSVARARFYASEIRVGGGAMYSTVEDLWRAFRAAFTRPENDPRRADLFRTRRGEFTGRAPGFTSSVFVDRDQDLYVVSLSNIYQALDSWGQRLYRAAVNRPVETTVLQPLPAGTSLESYRRFAGDYAQEGRSPTIRIDLDEDGELVFDDRDNDWKAALIPLAGGEFFHPYFDSICRFDETGSPVTLQCRSSVPASDSRFVFTLAPSG